MSHASVRRFGTGPRIVALLCAVPVLLIPAARVFASDDTPAEMAQALEAILDAIRGEDIDTLRRLLDAHPAAINSSTRLGTPLHHAVFAENVEAATLLLARGADPNAKGAGGSPAHFAASDGRLPMLKLLVANKADLEMGDNDRRTPLHRAAMFNQPKATKYLCEAGARINARDKDDMTPLHLAAARKCDDVCPILLSAGADIEARDKKGWTPLAEALHAMRFGDSSNVAKTLLAKGAKVDIFAAAALDDADRLTELIAGQPNAVSARDINIETPLHWAAHHGSVKAAGVLLKAGADPNALGRDGDKPLFIAMLRRDQAMIEALVAGGTDLDIFLAAGLGMKEFVAEFVRIAPASVKAKDQWGLEPLHWAAWFGRLDMVVFLIDHGANVTANSLGTGTPLHYAAARNHRQVVAELLKRGASASAKDRQGRTALHCAARSADEDVVALLARDGVTDMTDNKGDTALHIAAWRGREGMAKTLLASGARTDLRNAQGETPADTAESYGYQKLAALIRKHEAKTDGAASPDSVGNGHGH